MKLCEFNCCDFTPILNIGKCFANPYKKEGNYTFFGYQLKSGGFTLRPESIEGCSVLSEQAFFTMKYPYAVWVPHSTLI